VSLYAATVDDGQKSNYQWHDVRFIGALPGRYALPDRRATPQEKLPVYACRLCSISTRMLVAMGPVVGREGETVSCHFDEFGLLHGRITRRLASGFVSNIMLSAGDRGKLGARIEWHKKHVNAQVFDKRVHKRFIPRDPRSVLTLGDGSTIPCFVIDMSQSGAAISAHFWPDIGTPMALGRLVGRVVRYLEVGFALQFIEIQDPDRLEKLLQPPSE
jgi:PilZ domain.